MTESIQIGNIHISQAELVPLLQKYQMLPSVLRELVIDRAIAEIECQSSEQLTALKQFYDRHELTSEVRLGEWLNTYYLDRHQLSEIAIRQFKIEKFKQVTFGNEIESYFLKRKRELDKAVYSLIRTTDPGIAQEIYFRSIDGEQSFAELAREYSQGAESQTGGMIGPVELSAPHPTIAAILLNHPVGKVHHPVQLDKWYVIIRPEQIITARFDEAMRQRLLDELFQAWIEESMQLAMQPNPQSISV